MVFLLKNTLSTTSTARSCRRDCWASIWHCSLFCPFWIQTVEKLALDEAPDDDEKSTRSIRHLKPCPERSLHLPTDMKILNQAVYEHAVLGVHSNRLQVQNDDGVKDWVLYVWYIYMFFLGPWKRNEGENTIASSWKDYPRNRVMICTSKPPYSVSKV